MIELKGRKTAAQERLLAQRMKRAKRRFRRWGRKFKAAMVSSRRIWNMVKLVEQRHPGLQPRRVIIRARSLDQIRAAAYWRGIELEQHRQNKTRR